MIDPRDLNARGVRAREAVGTLVAATAGDAQLSLLAQYIAAVLNNLLLALEADAGVMPSYFGSQGFEAPELNPYTGLLMPPAVSNEPPPLFNPPSS